MEDPFTAPEGVPLHAAAFVDRLMLAVLPGPDLGDVATAFEDVAQALESGDGAQAAASAFWLRNDLQDFETRHHGCSWGYVEGVVGLHWANLDGEPWDLKGTPAEWGHLFRTLLTR